MCSRTRVNCVTHWQHNIYRNISCARKITLLHLWGLIFNLENRRKNYSQIIVTSETLKILFGHKDYKRSRNSPILNTMHIHPKQKSQKQLRFQSNWKHFLHNFRNSSPLTSTANPYHQHLTENTIPTRQRTMFYDSVISDNVRLNKSWSMNKQTHNQLPYSAWVGRLTRWHQDTDTEHDNPQQMGTHGRGDDKFF